MELTATSSSAPGAEWIAARASAGVGPHFGDPWLAYRRAQNAGPAFVTVAEKRSGVVAVGVLHMRRSRFQPWGRADASADRLPWWTPAGREIAAAEDGATGLARALVGLAKQKGFRSLAVDSFDGPSPPPDWRSLCDDVQERYEFLLDLTRSADERFAALKSSHRRKVRDAEAGGVAIEDETGRTGLDLLRGLQEATAERRAARGEEMDLPDAERYRLLAETFVAGGGGRLFVGRIGGAPVSAILCGVNGARAYYFMGGTNAQGLAVNAATLVMTRAATLLAAAGVQSFNLGGVARSAEREGDPAHGLYRFKEGFGAARLECVSAKWTPGRSG
jgi:GNAT acetyltransferase-like protein